MLPTLSSAPDFLQPAIEFTSPQACQPSRPWQFARPVEPSQKVAAWSAGLKQSAQRLLTLKQGWDGPGSSEIPLNVVRRASQLVADALAGIDFAEAPYLVPGGDGSVQVEWHEKHGELELDLSADGKLHIVGRNYLTGAEFEGEDEEALALFFRWAAWVAAFDGHEDHEDTEAPPAILEFAA